MKRFLTAALCLVSTVAFAEGYQVNMQSTKQAGMGHTGTGMKLGAESMHFNPAGLVYMKKHVDLSAGIGAVFTKVKFDDQQGYTAHTDNSPSTPMAAYAGFMVYQDKLAVGLAVTTPYGSGMDWGRNWKGAFANQDISLRSVVYQPTVSWKPFDKLSIGAGLMIATGKVELSRAMISDAAFQSLAQHPNYADYAQLIQSVAGSTPVSVTFNGTSKVRLGYNIGILYEPAEWLSLGLSYRSKVQMKVDDGTAKMHYANVSIQSLLGGSGLVPPLDQGTFSAELPLPYNLTFGASFTGLKRWILSFDVQHVGWEAYRDLTIVFNESAIYDQIGDIVSEKHYRSTVSWRLGAQFAATERLDLRCGVYLDPTPVRKHNYNPETPGAHKVGGALGLSFRPYTGLSIDAAFTLIRGFKRFGSYTNVNPFGQNEVLEGNYTSLGIIPSIGISYNF